MKKLKRDDVFDMLLRIDDELFDLALNAAIKGDKVRSRALADAAEIVKGHRRSL
jgi:hypothetical protein